MLGVGGGPWDVGAVIILSARNFKGRHDICYGHPSVDLLIHMESWKKDRNYITIETMLKNISCKISAIISDIFMTMFIMTVKSMLQTTGVNSQCRHH